MRRNKRSQIVWNDVSFVPVAKEVLDRRSTAVLRQSPASYLPSDPRSLMLHWQRFWMIVAVSGMRST